jgi:YVTN family beta-propeller protein
MMGKPVPEPPGCSVVFSIRSTVVPAVAAVAVLALLVASASLAAPSADRLLPLGGPSAHLATDSLTVSTITVGKQPIGVAYDASNKEVYVANYGSNTTSALKTPTGTPTKIPVGHGPAAVTYDPTNKDIYVLNEISGTVSVINGSNKVIHTLTLPGPFPTYLTYDPANGNIYTLSSNASGQELSDLNHSTSVVKSLTLGSTAESMAFDNATNDLVVSEYAVPPAKGSLQIISPSDIATTVKLTKGMTPDFMAYDPTDKDLFVNDLGVTSKGLTKTGNVSVLSSAGKVVKTISVAAAPIWTAYDPTDQDMYVLSLLSISNPKVNDTLTILTSSLTVAKTLTLGAFCGYAAYDPVNHDMYVPCARSNTTFVISSATHTIVKKLSTGGTPVVAFFDPGVSDMLVAGDPVYYNASSTTHNTVYVVPSSNTGITTLTLGTGAAADGVYDPNDLGVWVSNEGSGTVSVIL